MFINCTVKEVQFRYGTKGWKYAYNEISELCIVRKKKTYLIKNLLFTILGVLGYNCMIFSNFTNLYFIIPILLCYCIIFLGFQDVTEFNYYVLVRDINNNAIKIKISARHQSIIGKSIYEYKKLMFDQIKK